MNQIDGVVADPGGTVSLTFHRDFLTVQRVRDVTRTELFEKKSVFKIGSWSGPIIAIVLAVAGLICYLAGSDSVGRRLLIIGLYYFILGVLCALCRIDFLGFLGWLPDVVWLATIAMCSLVFLLPPVFNGADRTRRENTGPAIQVLARNITGATGGHRGKHVWVRLHFVNGRQVTYWVKARHGQHILELTRELAQGRMQYWPEPSR